MKKNWRIRVEERFVHLSDFIVDNRYKVFFFLLAMVVAAGINLPKITFDTSTEGFLYDDDPQILKYNAFRDQFGRDEKIIIAIKTDDVFEKDFLHKLSAIHKEIEEKTPYIKEVSSLINARKTTGNESELIVEDLFLDGIPDKNSELEEIKEYALSNKIYENLYLSEDATFTTIMITTQTYSSQGEKSSDELLLSEGFEDEFLQDFSDTKQEFITERETALVIESIESIIEKNRSDELKIYIAGSPIVTKNLQSSLIKDMSTFIIYVILTISALLFFMFRRISGVLLPLFLVLLALVATVAFMAITGVPISSMTQILPSLLLAVGVGASVHLLAIFYKQYDENGDKKEAIAYALGHSGLAIVMTSLTTAASLSSFSFSDIAPVAALGMFSALGVMFALVLTLVLVPAMLAILPIKPRTLHESKKGALDKMMVYIAELSLSYPKTIIAVAAFIVAASLILSSKMHFSHNPLHWFAQDNEVRINTETIDKELKGSITIEIVLDTKKQNGVYDPELLNAIERSTETISTFRGENYFIGKAVSINDVLKEIHKGLNENRDEFYIIPQDKELIAQEFLLFENSGSDDLEDIVDSQFSKTRLSLKAPWVDAVEYVELIDKIEETLEHNIGDMADVSVTGTLPILATTITKSIISSIESYIVAFIVIALLMMLMIGSIKLGAISLIPNLTPIMFGLAVMIIYDLPLDMFTILIGAIAIGMVVDDTIHFMHNFQRYHLIHNDVDKAVRLTLESTGRAIFITSIVLCSGFFVFMFASMTNLYNFGLITGVTVLMALATNLVLTAALMKVIVKNRV